MLAVLLLLAADLLGHNLICETDDASKVVVGVEHLQHDRNDSLRDVWVQRRSEQS